MAALACGSAAAGALVRAVPPPTYAPGGPERAAFDALNAARTAAGAGLLAQSPSIDEAARRHATYLTTNRATAGLAHQEDASAPAYDAGSPGQRLRKAGYAFAYAAETLTGGDARADCVRAGLGTPYHGAALLAPTADVGIAMATDDTGLPVCVIDTARPLADRVGQVPPAGEVVAWPAPAQAGVLRTFDVDYESPRVAADLLPDARAGTPILVGLRNADYLAAQADGAPAATVSEFSLADAAGRPVPAVILGAPAIRGTAGLAIHADAGLPAGFVVLVPRAPLAAGAAYTVRLEALPRSGGTPVAKTWTFTTGG